MAGEKALRISEVVDHTGVSNAAIRKMVKDGQFPQPYSPTPGIRAWDREAVQQWNRDRLDDTPLPDGVSKRYDRHGQIVTVEGANT